jgi:hypothetical protein
LLLVAWPSVRLRETALVEWEKKIRPLIMQSMEPYKYCDMTEWFNRRCQPLLANGTVDTFLRHQTSEPLLGKAVFSVHKGIDQRHQPLFMALQEYHITRMRKPTRLRLVQKPVHISWPVWRKPWATSGDYSLIVSSAPISRRHPLRENKTPWHT